MSTILITGTNRGIGLALTHKYLKEGWRVLACSRNPQESKELTALKNQYSNNLILAPLDVRDEKQIQSLANEWKSESIDILFNNAGISGVSRVEIGSLNSIDWLGVFLVNTVAPILIAQAFIKQVASSQRKIIATMSSTMGSIADNKSGKYYYYRSSKAAVNAAMKNLAIDLHSQNITCAALHPGWVKTDMGGKDAPLTVEESVTGLYQVLNELTFADSGKFLSYEGKELPW